MIIYPCDGDLNEVPDQQPSLPSLHGWLCSIYCACQVDLRRLGDARNRPGSASGSAGKGRRAHCRGLNLVGSFQKCVDRGALLWTLNSRALIRTPTKRSPEFLETASWAGVCGVEPYLLPFSSQADALRLGRLGCICQALRSPRGRSRLTEASSRRARERQEQMLQLGAYDEVAGKEFHLRYHNVDT